MGEPLSPQTQARHVFDASLHLEGSIAISQHIPPARQRPVRPPTKDITQALKLTLALSAGPPSQTESHFQTNKIAKLPKPQTVN